MNRYLRLVGASIAVVLLMGVALGILSSLSGQVATASASTIVRPDRIPIGAIGPQRATSIPYGITGVTLVDEGGAIEVRGHIDDKFNCPTEGDSHDIRVFVKQVSTRAFAKGSRTIDASCSEIQESWTVTAQPQTPKDFVAGKSVRVCAVALLRDGHRVVGHRQWCVTRSLQSTS